LTGNFNRGFFNEHPHPPVSNQAEIQFDEE